MTHISITAELVPSTY